MKNLDDERKTINRIDSEMAKLFKERMDASKTIATIKQENNLQIYDKQREEELIKENLNKVPNDIKKYYEEYLNDFLMISKKYQANLLNRLTVYNKETSYDIIVLKGSLNKLNSYLDLNRKVLLITDSGIPLEYISKVKSQIDPHNFYLRIVEQGELSKSIDTYTKIIDYLIETNFTRTDCIISLGGGMVGDLAGFIASSFMRGITYYNIPTTLLSQVDSSIGGKVAVNFSGIKNVIGAFYSPNKVIIDPTVLQTLPAKQLYSGLVEALKMAIISDEKLFNLIYTSNNIYNDVEEIIKSSIKIKKSIVEEDYKETGIRRILNFGHTVGHAIEAINEGKMLHGECVGIGMTYFIKDPDLLNKLIEILKRYNLPYETNLPKETLFKYIIHDKKCENDDINIVICEKLGSAKIEKIKLTELKNIL